MSVMINITDFFNNANHMNYSASAAQNGGIYNSGKITWTNANRYTYVYFMIDTAEKRKALREWWEASGACQDHPLHDTECNPLFLQRVAGDICDSALAEGDWKEYEQQVGRGECDGRIYLDDDGQIYYDLGE